MVAATPGNSDNRGAIMYINWRDFQTYMDEFRRDIQKKFDEHTDEHRSEKEQSKAFKIAMIGVATSAASALAAGIGLILTHLH